MDTAAILLGPLGATFLIGFTSLILLIWYSSRKLTYWNGKGIPVAKAYPIVGSTFQNFFLPQHESELQKYKKLGPIYGHYEGSNAAISVADPELLRDIMVKDFPFFANRRTFYSNDNTVNNMVSNLEGEDWKRVRTIITPSFTTGKLKRMIGIFKECSSTLVQNFKKSAENKKPINAKRMYGTMAMDVIASSAFSTKIDSHNDPDNKFVQMSRRAFGTNVTWRFIMFILAPKLMRFFRISIFQPAVMNFFKDATIQIIKERKRLNQTRNDFLQLLIDTAKEVADEEKVKNDTEKETDLVSNYGQTADLKVFENASVKSLSMDEIVAQCVLFFIAGYDTTASTLSFTSYLLALNPDCQEKAREDIRQCLEASKGELTYDAIQSMKYLDNVISETLRLFPPANRTERKADADYKLGKTGITVEKDMMVTIPIYAIHMDPKYYPNPEKFDPNRFTPEERSSRDPYVYMPFGAGPRNCVGMRFALLEVKVCLIYVLSHFNIKKCSKTQVPLKFYPGVQLLQPYDIYLEMEPRNDLFIK